MNKDNIDILNLPVISEPRASGWYYVQWEPTEFPKRVWLWEGGELWGCNQTDDPETVELTASDYGVAVTNVRWRKEPS